MRYRLFTALALVSAAAGAAHAQLSITGDATTVLSGETRTLSLYLQNASATDPLIINSYNHHLPFVSGISYGDNFLADLDAATGGTHTLAPGQGFYARLDVTAAAGPLTNSIFEQFLTVDYVQGGFANVESRVFGFQVGMPDVSVTLATTDITLTTPNTPTDTIAFTFDATIVNHSPFDVSGGTLYFPWKPTPPFNLTFHDDIGDYDGVAFNFAAGFLGVVAPGQTDTHSMVNVRLDNTSQPGVYQSINNPTATQFFDVVYRPSGFNFDYQAARSESVTVRINGGSAAPEPGSLALLVVGALAGALASRRRATRASSGRARTPGTGCRL